MLDYEFSTPRDAVLSALEAHVAGDWTHLSAHFDEASTAEWRESFIRNNTEVRSIEQWRGQFPDAAEPVLHRRVDEQKAAVVAFLQQLSDHVAGIATIEELRALSPRDLLARVFEAIDPVSRVNRLTAAAYAAAGLAPPPESTIPRPLGDFHVVRVEISDPENAAVLFQQRSLPDNRGTRYVRKTASDRWRSVLSAEVFRLPGGTVNYIQDPIVEKYLRHRS